VIIYSDDGSCKGEGSLVQNGTFPITVHDVTRCNVMERSAWGEDMGLRLLYFRGHGQMEWILGNGGMGSWSGLRFFKVSKEMVYGLLAKTFHQ
jgi:hypothetical protein